MADASVTELLPRLFISMAIVIAVMYIAARLLKGRQIPGSKGLRLKATPASKQTTIEVIARQGIGRNASVAVVRAGDKSLVLGITEQNISVLTQLDEAAFVVPELDVHGTDIEIDAFAAAPAADESSPSWKGLLTQVRESTVRR